MSDADLERAVTEPARLAGLRLETGLVELILRDVAREPGALPLLSHALRVTWEHRDGRTMTVAGYRETGGVASAVAQTADAVVASVPAHDHGLLRNVFVRLTELGDGIEDTRRRVRVEELVPEGGSREGVDGLLDRLAEARLLTLAEDTAEVAHEVLIREWPTLRRWLEEDRVGIRLHRELGNAAGRWEAAGRETGDLYRGTRLDGAVEWAQLHAEELNATERAFVDASVAASQHDADRQLRANRRLRALLAGAGILLVLAIVAGVVALSQRATARDAATAEAAQRLGAEAVSIDRIDRALRLANAGFALDDSPATRSNLLRVLLRNPAAMGVMTGDGDRTFNLALSSDGALVALGDVNGSVTIFDTADFARIGGHRSVGLEVYGLEFAPGREQLALVGLTPGPRGDRTAQLDLVDARSQRLLRSVSLRTPFTGPVFIVMATYAEDGRSIVVAWLPEDPRVPIPLRRFDARSGAPLGRARSVPPISAGIPILRTAPDGRLLFTGPGGTYAIDGQSLRIVRRYRTGAESGAVSPESKTLALGDSDGRVRLLDLASGRTRALQGRHDERVRSAAFSSDGRTLTTGAEDGSVIVWDHRSGRSIEKFEGHVNSVADQQFSPDGRTLYAAGIEGSAIAWDVSGRRRLGARFPTGAAANENGGPPYPPGVSLARDGRELAVARFDGKVDLIDPESLRTRRTFQAFDGSPAFTIAHSPDGARLAVAGARGLIGIFDARTGQRIGALVNEPRGECADRASWPRNDRCYQATIMGAAFAGRDLLVTGAAGGIVQIWDTQRRRPLRPPLRLPREITGLDVSPDGSRLAVAFGSGGQQWGVEVVDVRGGRRVKRLSTPETEPYSVAFSPDGRLLAAGLANGTAITWETDRWRRVGDSLVHRGTLPALDFSADGRTLATASAEGTVAIWDVASRDPIGSPLPRPPDRRRRPAYLDATGGFGTPRFTPDGARLFVVSNNGHAVRWDLAPAVWRRKACAVAGGGLTRAEWEDAVPEQDYRRTCP